MGSFRDRLVKAGLVAAAPGNRAEVEEARRQRHVAEEAAAAQHLAATPRYPGARPLPLDAVRALFEELRPRLEVVQQTTQLEGLLELEPEAFTQPSAQVIAGDLECDELVLEPEGSNLVVRGDLRVKGLLWQKPRAGGLVVLGRLTAEHLVSSGAVFCAGGLEVPGVAYGNSADAQADVLGRASVGTLVSVLGHRFSFWGPAWAGGVHATERETPHLERYGPRCQQALHPTLVDLLGEAEVVAALRAHGTVFANA